MKTVRITLILAMSIYLFGCASGATIENMAYQGEPKSYSQSLKESMEVTSVHGGEKTNPLWTSEIDGDAFGSAIKQSLSSQGLLSDNGRYQLEVRMLQVDQPLFGLDMTVTTHVQYILTDSEANSSVVMDETVVAPYTATVGDAFIAVKRLQMANEGAGRENIEGLLDRLARLQIKPGEITLAQ